jgi:hypothetical protein
MVVIATPAEHPIVPCCNGSTVGADSTPVSCAGQNVISAAVSTINGRPLQTRMRAITLTQGQCATVEWVMHDRDGKPVDLSSCAGSEDFVIVMRLKEQLSLGNQNAPLELPATMVEPQNGKVAVQLTAGMTSVPGIYYGEIALVSVPAQLNGQPCVIFSNTFSVVISRSTFDSVGQPGGPPSIAEIRLHLRDSAPGESFLLDNLMFDDAEIALAISRPVMYWNEVPPPIDAVFNTQSFPFRYHWLEGICANLFMMVAEQFRRNQFDYTAAGMSINDQNKEASYERAGQARWQAYRDWVRATKASINLESCYGEVSSAYKYAGYTDALRIRY